MRKGALAVLSVLALLLATPLVAQAPNTAIVRVAVWKVKPGMGQQFQDGLKKHNDFHRRQNDTDTLETWEVMSGDDVGAYLRIDARPSWTAYDTDTVDPAADDADSSANIDPYVDTVNVHWWRYMGDVSRGPMGGTPPAMSEVLFFRVKFGHVGEFMALIKKITEAANKTNWSVNYRWYSLENGGEHPTFAIVIPKTKMADFEEPSVSFLTMLEKGLGRAEADMVREGLDHSIQSERSEMIGFREPLSYIPKK